MPAAAADAGSNASLASTRAQTSPRWVARASTKSNTLVLPDEAVPQISVRQPRARPPVSESSCGMPLETISGAGRTSRREAGTTAASLEIAPTWAKISAVFLVFFSAIFFAIESAIASAFERGEDRGKKIKARPMAADEKIGEADILSCYCQLAIVREHRGQDQPGRGMHISLFIRLRKYRSPCCRCQGGPAGIISPNHVPELQ